MTKSIMLWLSPFTISLSVVLVTGCAHPKNAFAQRGSGQPQVIQDRLDGMPPQDDDEDEAESGEKESSEQSSLDAAMDLVQTAHDYWVDGDEEKSLEALDQAYGLIVGVKAGDDPKLIQQKEDIRLTISKRILEIYASRFRAAKGTHKAIPVVMNKYVDREIATLTHEERHFFVLLPLWQLN